MTCCILLAAFALAPLAALTGRRARAAEAVQWQG